MLAAQIARNLWNNKILQVTVGYKNKFSCIEGTCVYSSSFWLGANSSVDSQEIASTLDICVMWTKKSIYAALNERTADCKVGITEYSAKLNLAVFFKGSKISDIKSLIEWWFH